MRDRLTRIPSRSRATFALCAAYWLSYLKEDTMAIWNTLKGELDKAGRAAQDALDEGKLRLESHRAKQKAEAAAASMGFAIYRARAAGSDLEPERYSVLAALLAAAESEIERIELAIKAIKSDPPTDKPVDHSEPLQA
ncbi:MAG: hypothetical protein ABI664_14245 [bacterium]